MKKITILFSTILLISFAHAQTSFNDLEQVEELELIREQDSPQRLRNKYYRIPYTIKKHDTFSGIIKKVVKLNSVIDGNTSMIKKTIEKNPHIKDWDDLPSGEDIFLYVSPIYIDKSKLTRYMKKFNSNETRVTKFKAKIKKRFNTSLFYMASYGQFTQESSSLGSITFNESSPASLGIATSFFPKKSHFGASASAYYSYILPASSNVGTVEVDVPPEIGANIYLDYEIISKAFNIYGGLDYEVFNTFDLATSQTSSVIELNENSVIYATFGVSKFFYFFNRAWFSKLSLSQSISSSLSTNVESPPEPYEGMKYLIYLNTKISKKFYVHTLLKVHQMTSDDDLTTYRLGVGIGYTL